MREEKKALPLLTHMEDVESLVIIKANIKEDQKPGTMVTQTWLESKRFLPVPINNNKEL